MILDAGGGTVDAITYRLRSTNPLRMEKEEVTPEGAYNDLKSYDTIFHQHSLINLQENIR